ncbi:protein ZNRD2 isoform X1 [Neopsephotus bourkii]|uniref:protein ZNRD2 isoform X1 n=1 Tax=Neopsephotus bourkii TaxID=309878 RepID=UPI002AA54149|nr:protein ZNRD2 isoform X1 [Neopsephotus bourkii]
MALNAGAEPAPAAAELEARRERQEWVSRAMGQLLLRGYRMLGRCCPHCGTILLQDKDQKLHCVSCQDRDFDGSPAPEPTTASSPPPQRHAAPPRPEHCEGAATGLRGAPPPGPPEAAAVALARAAVLDKLGWAARELPRTASTEGSAQLCALVRACAEALGGLQALAPPGSPP